MLFEDYLLKYSSYVISTIAVLVSIMTFTIVFTPGQIVLIGIIIFVTMFLLLCMFFMARFKKSSVMAKAANTFSLAILSSQYPNLKTINEIESKWNCLWCIIHNSGFWRLRELMKYSNLTLSDLIFQSNQ